MPPSVPQAVPQTVPQMPTTPAYAAAPNMTLYGERSREEQETLLRRMREHFGQAQQYEDENRRRQVAELDFRAGKQWDPAQKQARESVGRPCLTINTLGQSERQITNDLLLNMPSVNVLPVGNGADVDTAKILKGIIRHCNARSHDDEVRQLAFDAAVRVGAGYYRMVLEYDGWDSFDQEPRIAAMRNQFACYLDPSCTSSVGRGARWGFVFESQDKEAFRQEWGVDTSTMNAWTSYGDSWVSPHMVRIAEYFFQESQRMTLAQLQGGQVMVLEPYLLQDLPEVQQMGGTGRMLQEFVAHLLTPRPRTARLLTWIRQQAGTAPAWLDGMPPEFVQRYASKVLDLVVTIQRVRATEHKQVRWIKTNGHVILEESIWPGQHIPLLRVVGEELDLDNKVSRHGIITAAMDPMRLKNYFLTMMCEHVALAPVPGWLLDPRQIQGFEGVWNTANRLPHAYLPYDAKMTGPGGAPLPPPQRASYEPAIQGIALTLQMIEQYVQETIGIYQGNLGGPSRERSGRAILAKDEQTDTGTYHYKKHLANAMVYEGEQYVDLIPKTLSPGKIQRILGDDGSSSMVRLTASPQEAQAIQQDPQLMQGMAGVYDLSSGSFDVLVDIGPSYATKRQEAADQMLQLTQTLPQAMGPVIAQVVEKMDWEGAHELSDLLKQLPGQILPQQTNNKDAQLALMRQQLMQAGQQLQALNAHAQQQEQAVQQLAQDNQRLKDAHDLEALKVQDMQRDSTLAEQKAAQDYQLESRKLDIEQQKVTLEAQRLYAEEAYKQATTSHGTHGTNGTGEDVGA